MDQIVRAFYELEFQLNFHVKSRQEFENWFAEIMELRYPGDFKRVRPWGSSGDRKNDGYLRSKRMMFQVYAPNELAERETLKKIDEDYAGAAQYWEQYFDTWVFVHNSRDGLSPIVNQKLLDLHSQGPFSVSDWSFVELHRVVFELDEASLLRLFRTPPAIADRLDITYANVENVLQFVARKPILLESEVRVVPPGKLDANGLSDDAKRVILEGNKKSKYVGDFFNDWHDPTYGNEVSNAFKQKYQQLKDENYPADDIFFRLLDFTGYRKVTNASDMMAVFAVVAYFFEVCDIFESPLE